jgi:hypothetical protein
MEALLTSTTEVTARISSFYKSVNDAPESVRQLLQELFILSDLLQLLETVLASVEESSSLRLPIGEVSDLLFEIYKKLPDKKLQGIKRLTWPFTEEDIRALISRLERYKTTFTLCLTT